MPQFRNKEDVYKRCNSEGNIIEQEEIDIDKIKANLRIAEEDLASAKDILQKKRYNSVFKIYYDVLHGLVEAFLSFDKVKSYNHKCLFAYLCVKHKELELDWNFFEKIRTVRNGIHYYGTPIFQKDWKENELQINLYINVLRKAVEDKLKK